jgi:hypothetical protein
LCLGVPTIDNGIMVMARPPALVARNEVMRNKESYCCGLMLQCSNYY